MGSTVSRNSRTLAPVRISCKNNNNSSLSVRRVSSSSDNNKVLLTEGPSCIFVGPIESANQETLEALYRQARDAYYSGKPLILDDMFDKVELKLRWYGSKYVVKYPRCSLRQQSTYADAEEDPSQVFALASVWLLFLGIGSSACLVPVIYTCGQALKDALDSEFSSSSQAPLIEFFAMLNGMLIMTLGSMIGYPVASASVGALQGLWKNDLVALKGACPNCGEEVFAFVTSKPFNNSPHKADCHVCGCLLEFRTKVERSIAQPGKRWVYGRIYLIRRRRMNRGQRWT
uniref:PGR5-like protein 1B, chloroplastic isoform X1 n=1 Tax=Tanacetum cinerariifolium TaxID=118510 RepID=A0A6L2MJX1_TANCI|nr:PGR5-like protein 1B, chloroplastic isoform X1 [Tanacetum cinerariifolium]